MSSGGPLLTAHESGRPTVDDVARLAGVSRQTVSRVCSGSGSVAAATRVRVLEAVSALGYRPDAAAQQLGARSSGRRRPDPGPAWEPGRRAEGVSLTEAQLLADAGLPLLVIPAAASPEQRGRLLAMAAQLGVASVLA